MIWALGAVGVVVLLALFFIGIYNGLVRNRNEKDNARSQIDVQLRRRHDLIPNLVESVKGYAKHEQSTFDSVIQARNQAISAKGPAEAGQAEGMLGAALGKIVCLGGSLSRLEGQSELLGAAGRTFQH
jgi:LemA protein